MSHVDASSYDLVLLKNHEALLDELVALSSFWILESGDAGIMGEVAGGATGRAGAAPPPPRIGFAIRPLLNRGTASR